MLQGKLPVRVDCFDDGRGQHVWILSVTGLGSNLSPETGFGGAEARQSQRVVDAAQGWISAVIDFGCLAVGDPAFDVMTAWLYLPAGVRGIFRATLQVDDATWVRARGLALSVGLIALPYYQNTNPALARIARRAIDETVADHNK